MTTPKASGRACITHHHACDCREARVAKLVEALEFYRNPNNWHTHHKSMETGEVAVRVSVCASDGGYMARAALDEWRKG